MFASFLLQAAAAALFFLPFDGGKAPGVQGQAAFFDGFDSRITVSAADVPVPEGTFTVDVWVCPLAFPKSPCPVVCRRSNDAPAGWSLWLDAHGLVHFKVAVEGEWREISSPQGLPLRQWSRLSASFRSGKGIFLAVDGTEVASLPLDLSSVEQASFDLWIGRTPVRTPSFMENKSIPIYSSFDGAVDELRISGEKDAYKKILKGRFVRPQAPGTDVPGFEERRLPSGPDGLAFGSWYVPLRFYKAFDDRWRGSIPDIVVGFGEEHPWKVVFWRGLSYAPCFVTEKGNWFCNEFVERAHVTKWGCPENMSDKHADFSSVRIVENTPARTVVSWRNLPVGVNQKIPFQSEETQWGDCSEETYIFYPDGGCVRRMDLWTSAPGAWYEWCQSLEVLHPSQKPEDVLDASRIMSVAAMDGRSAEYGWDFEGKARQSEPSIDGANIQVTYLRSEWNPFLILEDGSGLNEKSERGPRIDRYAGRWSQYSDFPWRNHWPLAQDYVIGRYACVADAASHTYTATQYNAPHSLELVSDPAANVMPDPIGHPLLQVEGVAPRHTSKIAPGELSTTWKMTKLMLCGCTKGDAASLLPLAKSWLRAPRLMCDGAEVPYDMTQRAYVMPDMTGHLTLEASPEHPACGVCIIVPGTGRIPSEVKAGGKPLEGFKAGVHNAWDGPQLILWLPLDATSKVDLELN